MTPESTSEFYWCLRHSRVESGDDVCAGKYRLGPYSTSADATRALERVQARNDEWESEDERWNGGH
jgi:hypothetical protein